MMPSPLRPLRFGILGCARIAHQFVRDVHGSRAVLVASVASRDRTKARDFAAAHGIARHADSYEALIADPDIDAVYVPLPNALHMPWCLRAVAQGKHVLCEKPLSTGLAQAHAMFDAARANGVMLLESYPYWFQPQTRDLLHLVGDGHPGSIGPVRFMHASFGFTLDRAAENIRWDPGLGGGALFDAGSYPVSLIRLVMGGPPSSVRAESTWIESGVDISTTATLTYPGGRRAQMSCAMDSAYHRHAIIVGRNGTLETEYLNHTADATGHPWGYLPSRMNVRKGISNAVPFQSVCSDTGSGFRFAAEAFAQVVASRDFDAIERAASASTDIAASLQAIAQSARTGESVELSSLCRAQQP